MIEEEKTTTQGPPQFIPKLKGKKVIIRLTSGGQPVTGTIEGYNPYEILLQTAKGSSLSSSTSLLQLKRWMSRKVTGQAFRSRRNDKSRDRCVPMNDQQLPDRQSQVMGEI